MCVGVWAVTISAMSVSKGEVGEKKEKRDHFFFSVKQQGDCVKSLPDQFYHEPGTCQFLKICRYYYNTENRSFTKKQIEQRKRNRAI